MVWASACATAATPPLPTSAALSAPPTGLASTAVIASAAPLATSRVTSAAALAVTVGGVTTTSKSSLPTTGQRTAVAVPATQAATTVPTSTVVVPLAATVNTNGQISVAALDAEVGRQLIARQSLNEPPPADMVAFRSTILDSLIQQTLIEQAAAIQQITVTDQDVDAEVQKYIQSAGGRDKWLAQVAADHMTEADYRAGLRSALLTLKMRDFVTRNIGTTADQVHARHILVADLPTAQQVIAQLKSGADFATLAAKYSLDVTTKSSGGDLGWFTRGQLLQQAIENAAFSLPLNQISTPIQTDLGYDILEVIEHQANRPLDPEVRARLSEQTFEIWLQTLLKAAHITKYI